MSKKVTDGFCSGNTYLLKFLKNIFCDVVTIFFQKVELTEKNEVFKKNAIAKKKKWTVLYLEKILIFLLQSSFWKWKYDNEFFKLSF